MTITQTSSYLRLTIRANSAYLAQVPNFFSYQAYAYIGLKNIAFTLSSSNKNVFPVYCALYKSDVVNPTTYYNVRMISSMPALNTLSGVSLSYVSNYYTTSGGTDYQTYMGAIRF